MRIIDVFIVNFEHISPSVSLANFEQVNVCRKAGSQP